MPATLRPLPREPVIYTDVLFGFVLGQFSIKFPDIQFKRSALGPLQWINLGQALQWYFKLARPLHTAPQVIAEMHGWAMSRANLYRPGLGFFWKSTQEELIRFGLEEELVRAKDMELETLSSFGPTEAAILALAKRFGGIVLTEDGRLRGECDRQEISVLRCSDVLDLWQQNQT